MGEGVCGGENYYFISRLSMSLITNSKVGQLVEPTYKIPTLDYSLAMLSHKLLKRVQRDSNPNQLLYNVRSSQPTTDLMAWQYRSIFK
jgi:hypothetical protein